MSGSVLGVFAELSHLILAGSLGNIYLYQTRYQMRKCAGSFSTLIKKTQLPEHQSRDLSPDCSQVSAKDTAIQPRLVNSKASHVIINAEIKL